LASRPKTLRLVLGDQLNYRHSWFRSVDPGVTYAMMEVRQETDYVTHHIQKIVGFFSAMRAFSAHIRKKGHRVIYINLDDTRNSQSITENILRLVRTQQFDRFEYLLPDEYRLERQLARFVRSLGIDTAAADTEHFLTSRSELGEVFRGRKHYLMETFYRHMRRKIGILMDGDKPLTGRWNYDVENRRPVGPETDLPEILTFDHNVETICRLVDKVGVKTMGTIKPAHFKWPVRRREALRLLNHFLENCLADFGTYEDAMTVRHTSLFHSRLSFALNTKMLSPAEVLAKALDYWRNHEEAFSIQQIEGFVRQVIGWREFMRGVYWAQMPGYRKLNFLNHSAHLPGWYWTGGTRLNCLRHVIRQSLTEAYAHHIQRLMVTGNFALLLGADPDEVDNWYLGIYIDAVEWVETTNTRGMSQFADGGIVATKPYTSSANYIGRMSDYCDNCTYDRKKKYGERACPFNSLYWDFLHRHGRIFRKNPRMGMMYRLLDRMKPLELEKTLRQAAHYKAEAATL